MTPLIRNLPVIRQIIRHRRVKAIKVAAQSGSFPMRVVIGASGVFDDGWIDTDASYLNLLRPDQWRVIFQPDTIDAMLAEHVWEHLTEEEGLQAARLCFRYLKPGGYLRIAVPDGNHPDPDYVEYVRPGGYGPGSDDHKVLYTVGSFSELFRKAGFDITQLEYYDNAHEFHCSSWDVCAGKIHRSKRFDLRNTDGEARYTSIIMDATKPIVS